MYTKQVFEKTKEINSEMIDFISIANSKARQDTPEWDKLKEIYFMMKLAQLQQKNNQLQARLDSIIKLLN